jgi:S-DNA-T family DNA segregation ATPase FtsK/SpoIIIE
VGAFISEFSFQLFGFAAYLVPAIIGLAGWHYFWCQTLDAIYTKAIGVSLFFGGTSALLSLVFGATTAAGRDVEAGGWVGAWLGRFVADYFNRTGAIIVLLTLMALAVIVCTQWSFGRMFAGVRGGFADLVARAVAWVRSRSDERRRLRERREVIAKHVKKGTPEAAARIAKAAAEQSTIRVSRMSSTQATAEKGTDGPAVPPAPPPPVVAPRRPAELPLAAEADAVKAPAQRRPGTFTLPPAALLDAAKAERKIDERELMEAARQLEEKCREFSVEGQVAQIHPGPVVTTFEFKPEAGVKYSKVTGLADDLCLAMQAESVLIDRIPGKSTVGIQIPNPNREGISLRELLESDAYHRSPSKLTLALGKTIHGEPYVTDLATMPHLLIAGSTGTGKSVGLNAMLTSILYRATPDDVRLIMIDPKRLELGMYEEIPHLLTPVVVDPKKAANALRWAVREMEERYKTLAAEGVRNIEQYNRNVRRMLEEHGGVKTDEMPAPLPFIVVVIDELADLDDGGEQRGRGVHRPAGADGPCRRYSPHPRDAAAVGGRHHRPHQSQPAGAHLVPGLVEDRLAYHPRRQRCRAAPRQGRHAVPAAGLVAVRAAARAVHLRAGERPPRQLPPQAGPARCSTTRSRPRTRRPGRAAWSTRRTSSTTRRRAWWWEAARCRSPTCSGSCASASAGPRVSST